MKSKKELKDMTIAELQEQLDDVKKELFQLQVQQVSGQLENPLQIRTLRRGIARIKTFMNQTASAEG
jgi:large subunit ribosomal protein L29